MAVAVNECSQIKREVLSYYAGGKPRCGACGEEKMSKLSLDHIGGGGNKHRRRLGFEGGSCKFYRKVRQADFPDGYRVLCIRCNRQEAVERLYG